MTWETFMNVTRGAVVALIIAGIMLLAGCVSVPQNVLDASAQCSKERSAQALSELSAMSGKLSEVGVIAYALTKQGQGDPCANMVTSYINQQGNVIRSVVGLGAVATPAYFSYKNNQNMFSAFGSRTPANINIQASTGEGGGGESAGSSGSIDIYTSVGGGINTGTQQTFEKGVTGGTGDLNDADTVNSDGVF